MEADKALGAVVLVMKGDVSATRIQLPPEDRPLSSLRLRYSLATLQLRLNATDHFALELTVGQSAVQRTKLIIGTHIKEPKQDMSLGGMPTAKLPLVIPRSKWVQVIFHLSGIVSSIFGMTPMQTVDSVTLCGTARVGLLRVSNSEQVCIDSTPEGLALFAVPAYAPPVWTTASNGKSKETATTAPGPSPPPSLRQDRSLAMSSADNSPLRQGRGGGGVNDLEAGCFGRSLHLSITSPKNSGLGGRGASVPARLEPISGGANPASKSEEGGEMGSLNGQHNGTPPPLAPSVPSARAYPSSLPSSSHGRLSAAGQGSPRPSPSPSLGILLPSTSPNGTSLGKGYIRLVSSASPRPGPQTRSFGVFASRRNGAGGDQVPLQPLAPGGRRDLMCAVGLDAAAWWDSVGSWEPTEGPSGPTTQGSSNVGPPAKTAAGKEQAESGGRVRAAPAKPKAKMTPEAERVQRLVAARKRKVGLVGSRPSGPAAGGDDDKDNNGGGGVSCRDGGGRKGGRRHRHRRRLQIIRANEKEANKMAVAKMLAPSEIPIKLTTASSSTDGGTEGGANGGDGGAGVLTMAADPKYGYGFGYMGVLHDNGEYEEDEGAGLKGAWSLAISDDDGD